MSAGKTIVVIVAVIVILLSIALSIGEIAVGALYLKECQAQRYVPIFLIVAGCFAFCSGGSDGAKMRSRSNDESGGSGVDICGIIVSIFLFAWLICGSVWVFQLKRCDSSVLTPQTNSTDGCFTFDKEYSGKSFYCHKTAYEFAFVDIVVRWVLTALLLIFQIVAMCA